MSNTKRMIDDIKKELAKARPKETRMTTKQIIEDLAEDINAQLKKGLRLDEVYEIIRQKLPDDTRMTLTTFKRYWREARDAAGLPKIRKSGRKNTSPSPARDPAQAAAKPDRAPLETPSPTGARDTSSDFREDPDDI